MCNGLLISPLYLPSYYHLIYAHSPGISYKQNNIIIFENKIKMFLIKKVNNVISVYYFQYILFLFCFEYIADACDDMLDHTNAIGQRPY